ncbi:hypothetical protein [Arthrobacter sp. 162MFSha1.1]|nr:hypothetical protein [Arthrobacter sp. 162MFSha1.1]
MMITGTLLNSDGSHSHIEAEGATYEEARTKLDELLQEGQQLIVIRTDHY